MKDIFGHKKPVEIETGEWWFNGRIIQKQNHPCLPKWISFEDNDSVGVVIHSSKEEAFKFALENPCQFPKNFPRDYIGGTATGSFVLKSRNYQRKHKPKQ